MRLEIVADVNIPHIREAFRPLGHVRLRHGEEITPQSSRTADVLLVRSVTPVTAALLEGGRVRFVGSATAGTEHIDIDYLASRAIAFAHAPGANAGSVAEYVLTALLNLSVKSNRPLKGLTLGVIGCGHIGSKVAVRARALGMDVLQNDPPRQARGEVGFVSLPEVLCESDAVTLHVPLTPHTHHLVCDETLRQLRQGSWLINTSRGAVADSRALKRAIKRGQLSAVVLDVWENEPHIDVSLLDMVTLATPHTAGHSFDGKIAGTVMLYEAAVAHFGHCARWRYASLLKPDSPEPLRVPDGIQQPEIWLRALAHLVCDLEQDDQRMRKILDMPADRHGAYFRHLRATYRRRRAFETYSVQNVPLALQHAVEAGLSMRIDQ